MASSDRPHVLVVEDEPVTRALVGAHLARSGFDVSSAEDGAGMRAVLERRPVDLVLLDVGLPGDDGFRLVAAIRASSNAGIIFLTRRADVSDRIVGLDLGGDDYVVKPPDLGELVARVRAVLRRRDAADAPVEVRRFGEWSVEPARRCLHSPRGEAIALTEAELAILATLLDARGKVVTRERLLERLRSDGTGESPGSLNVLVHRLRRKLGEGGSVEPRILLTVHGAGYCIAVERR